MKKILALVEGQTEEIFIKNLIVEHLRSLSIHMIPIVVSTKRVKSGKKFKGGIVSYRKVHDEIALLLKDSSADVVTTMLDYYGLPDDFPGKKEAAGNPYEKVQYVEERFTEEINHPHFQGYLNLHEFEGLLFSSPSEIARALNGLDRESDLQNIRDGFHSPEEINDDPKTAPSKRLRDIFPSYDKSYHGALASTRIGLNAIRTECPHFNEWLTSLENL